MGVIISINNNSILGQNIIRYFSTQKKKKNLEKSYFSVVDLSNNVERKSYMVMLWEEVDVTLEFHRFIKIVIN